MKNNEGVLYNKLIHCWIKPKGTVKSKPVNNSIDKKKQIISEELTYLIVGTILEFKQCKEGIDFSNVDISKNRKEYFVTFNIEMCKICDNYLKCSASKAKDNGILRVKKSSLKQVVSMNKKKLKTSTNPEAIITQPIQQDNELRHLLNDFIEKWEDETKRDVEIYSAEMQRLRKLFGDIEN